VELKRLKRDKNAKEMKTKSPKNTFGGELERNNKKSDQQKRKKCKNTTNNSPNKHK